MTTSAPVPPRGEKAASIAAAARSASMIALAPLIWAAVTGFASFEFSKQLTWDRYSVIQGELVGFAYAFAIAGSITGAMATATAGRWRLAIGLVAVNTALIAASIFIIRLLIVRATAPSIAWYNREWEATTEMMKLSTPAGIGFGLALSVLVLAASILERRMASWQFGIAVAGTISVLGLWILPPLEAVLTSAAIPYLRWSYGYRLDAVLQGALTGAGTGALAGAIVIGLLARGFCAPRRPEGARPIPPASRADANEPGPARV